MRSQYTTIGIFVDGNQLTVEVINRALDQLATTDDLHTREEYVSIAMANVGLIETAVRRRLSSHPFGMPMRLERADIPDKL